MKDKKEPGFQSDFEKNVYEGLTSNPKKLSSRYFYDKKGDKLFQDIMGLPEYYLTSSEYNIVKKHAAAITEIFDGKDGFDLIELGAGDGKKTKILLDFMSRARVNFYYYPVDISQNVLDELENSLKKELPEVKVKTQQGTYFNVLEKLAGYKSRKKVIMMLGSNIGNLLHQEAVDFLLNVQKAMNPEDLLFLGFDQKKDPSTILKAYNDSAGVTEAFNKNLLHRINSEMNADFNVNSFLHWPTYNPETGTVKSFLVSKIPQEIEIQKLQLQVHFDAWETIHTEISQKYDDAIVEWLAAQANLKVIRQFSDEKEYYKNYIFRVKTS